MGRTRAEAQRAYVEFRAECRPFHENNPGHQETDHPIIPQEMLGSVHEPIPPCGLAANATAFSAGVRMGASMLAWMG